MRVSPSNAPQAPAAHKTTHEPGGSDALTALTDASFAAANKDGTAGTLSLRTLGTSATSATAGNDARLTDARTPTAHATSHQPGGSDALAVDAAAATGSLRTLGKTATTAAKGDDTEYAFSAWKDIRNSGAYTPSGSLASGTYLLIVNNAFLLNTASSGVAAYYLDPADYSGGSTRTTKIRMRGEVITNAVAPTVNFTFGLYPVASWGGASGAAPVAVTLGTVVGSTAAINAPGATTQSHVETTAATFPSAGWYVMTVATSGTSAANSNLLIHAALQVQQV